jgi:hypothetical protein
MIVPTATSSTEFWLIANTDVTQIVGQFRGKGRVGDNPPQNSINEQFALFSPFETSIPDNDP